MSQFCTLSCLTPVIQTVSNGRVYLLLLRQSTCVGFVWICCIIWCMVSGMPSVPGAVPCRQTWTWISMLPLLLLYLQEILWKEQDKESGNFGMTQKVRDEEMWSNLSWTIKRWVKHQRQTAWKKAPYCLHGDGQMEVMINFAHRSCIHPILLLFIKRTDLKCLSRSLLQHGCIHWRWWSLMQTFN